MQTTFNGQPYQVEPVEGQRILRFILRGKRAVYGLYERPTQPGSYSVQNMKTGWPVRGGNFHMVNSELRQSVRF